MDKKFMRLLLGNLENTCFPVQINWSNEELYLNGLLAAFEGLNLDADTTQDEFLIELLENLENTCFPVQIDWNNQKLYISGLRDALKNTLKNSNLAR